MSNKEIGNRIKEARKGKGLTQEGLAQWIGRTKSSIKKYEAGQTEIPLSVSESIAAALGVSQAELLGIGSEPHWIPCSERLPDGAYPVIVTWKNTDPASYYQYILGKHYVGVAHYKNGKWYWYSSVTEDVLMEYGRYDSEEFDEAIECMAWMPLPEPYREDDNGQTGKNNS